MLLISKTFERWTPEDIESGEPSESGFEYRAEPMRFRDVVELLRHGEPSSYPALGNTHEWITHHDSNGGTREFYESGIRENVSYHFARENPPRNAKWWKLAMRHAGL